MNLNNHTLRILTLVALAAALCPAQGVRINEVDTANSPSGSDYCELANLSDTPVHLGGWQAIMSDDPSTTTVVTFAPGTVLNPNEVLVIAESTTSPALPAGVQRISSANINWTNTGGAAAGLNDPSGAGMDLVIWGGATNLPAQSPPSPFTGSLPPLYVAQRNSSIDTDTAADWTTSSPWGSGTPGSLNPGQTPVAPAMPNAAFLVTNPTVLLGEGVSFIDQTSGIATSWQWDFDNDGLVDSTQQHPTFTYPAPGTYDVTLTASNALGSGMVTVPMAVTVLAAVSVTVPYVQSFTTGPLGPEWSTTSENASGRIQLAIDGSPSPLSGGNALQMDCSTSGTQYCTNAATLRVDLLSSGGGILKYYFRETSDEDDPEDGVFLSDGTQTVQIVNHNGGSSTWVELSVDLLAAATTNGLNITSTMLVIFQQRDNYPVPTDGVFIDDVRIVLPDIGQANQLAASLDLNGGLNINGSPADIGVNGPFYASGNTATFTVSGEPNQPWVLLMGPLLRNNLVIPGVGSLDVGMMGASGNISDVSLVLDGIGGTGFWDQFAVLDATGESELLFGLGVFTPGVLGTFQVATLTGGGSGVALSAACELTVTP